MSTGRRRFRVTGIVQGVGFRPYVYGLATRLRLTGFVRNDDVGVVVEVEGAGDDIDTFRDRLLHDPPPLAVVESVDEEQLEPRHDRVFNIETSTTSGRGSAPISPDVATCEDCLRELFDPMDRRYRYPFINCTACGPRFTITRRVPYDRVNTTMASFDMCVDCRREYEDPRDRRFHAEPIACPRCGPHLRLGASDGTSVADDPLRQAAALITSGAIVAVKGLGGYHLACDATDDVAVQRLRARKAREEKPFAIMVADLEAARELVVVGGDDERELLARRAPIVLARRRSDAKSLAASVAPGNAFLGVMLPYTPLHHLLMERTGRPIVLTSGNVTDEPLAFQDEDAYDRLGPIADAFLTHDREIHVRCDDAVIRLARGERYPIRRSRGFAPEPLDVHVTFADPVLGVGAELKNTFCIGTGRRAILSQHVGDLENWEAFRSFTDGITHLQSVFDVVPAVVAHDLHPDYLSTKWAAGQPDVLLVGVQHHHAHLSSCLADNGRGEPAIGLILDGTGYGADGTIWGCEVLVGDPAGYERFAHLRPIPLPGGAAAVREPWRVAAVYLDEIFGEALLDDLRLVARHRGAWPLVTKMARDAINSPVATSAGRLFDAVAALCGIRDEVTYEGQAAAELEQLAGGSVDGAYPSCFRDRTLDGHDLIAAVVEDLRGGTPPNEVAAAFHGGLVRTLADAATAAREATGVNVVALSGGTFQNVLLLEGLCDALGERGFEVLTHRRVPCNDGGISLGQVVVANALRQRRTQVHRESGSTAEGRLVHPGSASGERSNSRGKVREDTVSDI